MGEATKKCFLFLWSEKTDRTNVRVCLRMCLWMMIMIFTGRGYGSCVKEDDLLCCNVLFCRST